HGGDDPAADGVPPDPADGLCGAGRALRPPPGSRGGRGGSRALSGLSLVRSSLGIVWEPPPRGRILPAARSSRKVQSRRGRRSYRGWGQPGGLVIARNSVGAPAPGANSAGRSEWPEGSIAPGATLLQTLPGLLYLPRRLSYRPENSISISEIRPWLLPLMICSAPAKASGTPTSGMTSFSSWATAPWPGTPSATI